MKVLVTGAAGFIGFHTVKRLLLVQNEIEVVGLDNINDYYPMTLKFERLKQLGISPDFVRYNDEIVSSSYTNFKFIRLDLVDEVHLMNLFRDEHFDFVIHLAAQAGVRFSIDNPSTYIQSNIVGFNHILEACRTYPVKHLVYASSSSVYGLNKQQPFSVNHRTDEPVSLYAATKKSNELMAHSYSHLFRIPTTGLRFFTVYGAWGRPDMAPMLFAKAIMDQQPIKVFNNGDLERDFTYVDDIVEGVINAMNVIPRTNENGVPFKIYNIGNSKPVKLLDFINEIESALGRKAIKQFMPMQEGDVYSTYADVSELEKEVGYRPDTSLSKGIKVFAQWYLDYKAGAGVNTSKL